jgi:hypothetical protein
MIPASLVVKKYLEYTNLVSSDLTLNWTCFVVTKLPDARFVPDNLVAIIEDTAQNANPPRFYADGEFLLDYLFHIKIRGIDLETTWIRANEIATSLDSIRMQRLIVDGNQYVIKSATRQSNIANTGRDSTGRRWIFNIDYLCAFE